MLTVSALMIVALTVVTSIAARADDTLTCPAAGASAATETSARQPFSEPLFTRPEHTVPNSKRTARGLYVTARDAYDMVHEAPGKVLFVDVRTRGELQFVGMAALVDVNVPFLLQAEPPEWDAATASLRLVQNPDFVQRIAMRLVQNGLARDAPIILMCQAGVRAARAADVLTKAGFANVYTVIDGFEGDPLSEGPQRGLRIVNGWRNAGLPWSTRLEKDRLDGVN
jgi:rhodanese-related sulfurtransferase